MRRVAAILLIVGAALAASAAAGQPAAGEPSPRNAHPTGDVIVRFKPAVTLADVGGALASAQSEATATGSARTVLATPAEGESVDDAVAAFEANPNVEYAEPDLRVSLVATPNDTHYPSQWHYPQIGLPAAWDTTTGSASVVVAVIDTGVQLNHPDLDAKITGGANFVRIPISTSTNASGLVRIATTMPHSLVTGDTVTIAGHGGSGVNGTWTVTVDSATQFRLNGSTSTKTVANITSSTSSGSLIRINTATAHGLSNGNAVVIGGHSVAGTNGAWLVTVINSTSFTLNGSAYSSGGTGGTSSAADTGGTSLRTSPRDDHGHGTMVAGYIAAETNTVTPTGVAGVCWQCMIMPVKALDASGNGSIFDVAQAIDYARINGAEVINLSLGAGGTSITLQTAVDNAYNAGIVVVGAAGNYADDADPFNDGLLIPAAYDNAIGVGASDSAGNRSSFSNYGPELDVMAPGQSVLSTMLGGGYGSGSGTSFAAPHVSGVVALMMSAGITDPSDIYDKLTSTATDMGSGGFDNLTGYGRINAAAAVAPPAAPYGVTWGANTLPTSLAAGSTTSHNVTFTNSGSMTWNAAAPNQVRLGYRWYSGACPAAGSTSFSAPRASLPSDVGPGGTVTNLALNVTAPSAAGTYCLVYDLVKEGVTWFAWQGASTQSGTVTITAPLYGVSWGSNPMPTSMAPGSTTSVQVTFTNIGSLTWNASPPNQVRLGYRWYSGACPASGATSWSTPRVALPANVAPGGTVTNLSRTITAPSSPGTYCLVYDLVREGIAWFSTQGAAMRQGTVTITAPIYAVSWGADTTPSTMTAGANHSATVTFTNTGSLTWNASPPNQVRLSYHWRNGACGGTSTAVWDGLRTALPSDVANGGTVSGLSATVKAPASPGTYCLVYDLVREGVAWFSSQGAATLTRTVTVNAP